VHVQLFLNTSTKYYLKWGLNQKRKVKDVKKSKAAFLVTIVFLSFTISSVVNAAPVADADGPYVADEGDTVTFDGGNSLDLDGNGLLYRWDFDGDGVWETDYSSDPFATYVWNDDWSGTATLEVSNGSETNTATASVTINNVAPIAVIDLVTTPTPLMPGDIVTFNGSAFDPGILDKLTFEWDFGDGASALGADASHSFSTAGTYTISLNVTDDDGGFTSATCLLSVLMPANVDIHPESLNLDSNGRWITCIIELPEGYDTSDVDVTTIFLDDVISAEAWPTNVEDGDGDGILEVMLKFDREAVQQYISETFGTEDDATLTVFGSLAGQTFIGADTIKVNTSNKHKNQNTNADGGQNGNTNNNRYKNTPNNENNNKFKNKNNNGKKEGE
jgi:chitodextrinase